MAAVDRENLHPPHGLRAESHRNWSRNKELARAIVPIVPDRGPHYSVWKAVPQLGIYFLLRRTACNEPVDEVG